MDWKSFENDNQNKLESTDNKEEVYLAKFNLALSLANQGKAREAHEILNEIDENVSKDKFIELIKVETDKLKGSSDELLYLNYLAFTEVIKENYQKSIIYFEDIINKDKNNVWPYNYLAASYIEINEYERAENIINKAREIEDNDYSRFLLGVIHYRKGSYLQAVKEFSNSGEIFRSFITEEKDE
ncbi:MAG: tetratricopeptide repeat protein [Bacillota bacterium]